MDVIGLPSGTVYPTLRRLETTLLGFLKSAPVGPTLTLTAENTRVKVDGDTAIVIGRRVERRRREDNNREGAAFARYMRTYIKRQGR